MTIFKALLSSTAAAAMLSMAPAVSAAERTIEVKTTDLNLSRPSAQAQLQKRISRAVRKVCQSGVTRNLGERQDVQRCEAAAWSGANAQMPVRIAEHKAQRGRKSAARLKLASD